MTSSRGEGELPAVLRCVTYLSPSIPLAFFEAFAGYLGGTLGREVSLSAVTQVSGPARGAKDPFSGGEADLGFLCAPSFLWLREREVPPVELAGAAPVFREDRAPGSPVYFSEVVVSHGSPVRSFLDLRGHSWAYNDPCSLSGLYSMLKKLAEMGEDVGFFGETVRSGSHLRSMQMVERGEVDAAAIDSNALRLRLHSNPGLGRRLRVIESWGPFPIQPVVLRSNLEPDLKESLRAALLTMGANGRVPPALAAFGLQRFAPVTREDYAEEERALRECEDISLSPEGPKITTGRMSP